MAESLSASARVSEYLLSSANVKRLAAESCAPHVAAAAAIVAACFAAGGKVLICGNGGSAADAQHIAAEFVSTLTMDRLRRALPAVALTTDTSFLTANANDFGFENVFARQVEALGTAGDVLIGISTSGTSTNVVRAFEVAAQRGMRTISFIGAVGRALKPLSDVSVCVPSERTAHIQEGHIAIAHVLCELVERELFPELFAA